MTGSQEERAARLKAALRENLRRRKAQERDRGRGRDRAEEVPQPRPDGQAES